MREKELRDRFLSAEKSEAKRTVCRWIILVENKNNLPQCGAESWDKVILYHQSILLTHICRHSTQWCPEGMW
jgi:hypothetical protein